MKEGKISTSLFYTITLALNRIELRFFNIFHSYLNI